LKIIAFKEATKAVFNYYATNLPKIEKISVFNYGKSFGKSIYLEEKDKTN